LKISHVTAEELVPIYLIILICYLPADGAAAPQNFQVFPNQLAIGESFQGAEIKVSAEIPQGSSAVVEFKGDTHQDRLLRKGRRGGLWMNVGEVTVDDTPTTYLLMSTDPELVSDSASQSQWGYSALQKQVKLSGSMPKGGKDKLFQEFIKLKESEQLYGIFPGELKLIPTSDNRARVEGQFFLPDKIPPANYKIHFFVLNNGNVVEEKTTEFPIEMQGIPAVLTSLAYDHSTLYGLIAVILAIVAGFAMGIIFKGKGAH
jgi:hypothetical protein